MITRAFVNGRIYASLDPLIIVDGIVVSGSRIIYAGSSSKALDIARITGGDVVDLNGRVVLPSFIDAHLHMDSLGLLSYILDLRGVKSIRELKERLREYINNNKPSLVIGRGWNQEEFIEARYPTRSDLDEVTSDIPVLLLRVCGHMAVLNTAGLRLVGFLEHSWDKVLRDEKGAPSGLIIEDAVGLAHSKFKEQLTSRDYRKILMTSQSILLANGVSMVGFVSCSINTLRELIEMNADGELKLRVRVYLQVDRNDQDSLSRITRLGLRAGFGDSYLKIMGIKLFLDGSLGARTAWLTEPYSDSPGENGSPLIEREDLLRIAKLADESGLQIAVHAIGDRAIDMALDVYSELKNTRKLRHRIEHVSVLRDDQVELMRKIGVVAVVQPRFIISDWWAKKRLGERAKWLYRFKTMIESGIPIAFSTDAPVEPVNPWETVYSAITRGYYENIPFYEDTRHEALDLKTSLYSYTIGSSYALHEDQNTGKLLPGMYADFIIVDKDPFTVDHRELRAIKILETYIGGMRASA